MSKIGKESSETGVPWHVVEEAINRETEWLQRVIDQSPKELPREDRDKCANFSSFITAWICYLSGGKGANPAAIQILLGHESLNTTTRYVHTSDKYAEETHRKFHPLSEADNREN